MKKTKPFFSLYPASVRQKIAFVLALALLLTFSVTPRGYAQTSPDTGTQTYPYKKTFVISGYYSPLPDQSRYYRGNYADELKLEGNGTNGADGTQVYPGMIAAPGTFPFGTKIDIPGLGVGTVHDRGGAIKGNRLDVWMGRGEEGLQRAFGWGMRSVEVTVYGPTNEIEENLNWDAVPLMQLTWIGTPAQAQYFKQDLAVGDEGDEVRNLQQILRDNGYDVSVTGTFDDRTRNAVIEFQLGQNIIQSKSESTAGYFGPKTRAALGTTIRTAYTPIRSESLVASSEPMVASVASAARPVAITATSISTTPVQTETFVDTFTLALKPGDRGEEVKKLQEELIRLHFLGVAPTAYYGSVTEHAVFKFQQAFGLIKDEKDTGAGSVGPKTLAKLNAIAGARQVQTKQVVQAVEKRELVASRVKTEQDLVVGNSFATEVFTADLSLGSRGKPVELLQQVLKRLGFFPSRLTTEYFGEVTKTALQSFQRSHGIDPTGVLDILTRRVLNEILTPGPQAS